LSVGPAIRPRSLIAWSQDWHRQRKERPYRIAVSVCGSRGVGIGGLGDGQPGLVGVGVRGQAKGLADMVPAVPGFACLPDVLAGGVPGAELDVPRGAGAVERLQVADGQI
jgi:hypothetical protein